MRSQNSRQKNRFGRFCVKAQYITPLAQGVTHFSQRVTIEQNFVGSTHSAKLMHRSDLDHFFFWPNLVVNNSGAVLLMTGPAPFSGGRGLVSKPPKRSGVDIQLLLPHLVKQLVVVVQCCEREDVWSSKSRGDPPKRHYNLLLLLLLLHTQSISQSGDEIGDWRVKGRRYGSWLSEQ